MADDKQPHHESTGLNARRILWSTGALTATLVAALVASAVLMVWFDREMPPGATASPPATSQRGSATAEVEPNQEVAMGVLRRRHQQLLSEYRWLRGQREVARIPIDRAMELLAEHE